MVNSHLFQHGTLALLVPGLFTGTLGLADLLKHGNYGIGTVAGLAGEMIVLDGQAYQIQGSGVVAHLDPATTTVPFANVHFEGSDLPQQAIQDTADQTLEQAILQQHPYKNLFFAVKLTGRFAKMHTRAVEAQVKPYPNLTTATRVQPEFTQTDVSGTLVGYYSPALYHGAASAGFHLHFLNDAHNFGGHVLDFHVADAQLQLQKFDTFELHLPTADPDFLASDFDLSQIHADITEAE